MAQGGDINDHKTSISHLSNALRAKKYSVVKQLCRANPQDLLQNVSIYNDTALHLAAHYCTKRKDLLLDLLKMLPPPDNCNPKLSDIKNNDGNTILHEVAATGAMEDVAEELLKIDPDLLTAPNHLGEKPIFRAARYGQTQMFEFLAKEMKIEELSEEESKAHLQRNDGSTVLHISIITESFHLSSCIVERYPYLIKERDQYSMTAFQYLACNPTAFQNEKMQIKRGVIEHLNKWKAPTIIQYTIGFLTELYDEAFKRDMVKRKRWLKEVVKRLAQHDTSWDASINSQEPKEAKKEENPQQSLKSSESPLFLAIMSNIKEIVKAVLLYQPEALKYTNKDGMNILHVAILYRHTDIFDMVLEKFEVEASRLLLAKDRKGNTVLHMISQKRKSQASEKMQSPAIQLRDELLLFENVKAASTMLGNNPLNKENKTAEELFTASNEKLHQDAKEWLMRTTENCTILSVFIATVAFAAAYTVPGGPNQNSGYPMLHCKPFFGIFVAADIISIAFALTSVGIFLSILTSSFPLQDFKRYLFKKLERGIICLILSVSTMAVAFGATIVLMMSRNRGKVVWDMVAFLPVPIFFLSYSPIRSVVLGPCRKLFESFVVCFILFVVIPLIYLSALLLGLLIFVIAIPIVVVELIILLPLLVLFGVFIGLRWAYRFIRKHVHCMSKNQSQPVSDTTLTPQLTTAAPLIHQV